MVKLLIVDDDELFRLTLQEIIGKEYKKIHKSGQLEILSKENGKEALEAIFGGYIPDIILADVVMPELSGIGLIERLTPRFLYGRIKYVYLMSGLDDQMVKIAADRLGAIFIYKGVIFNPGVIQYIMDVFSAISTERGEKNEES